MRDLAGCEVGIFAPQRDEAAGAGVEVGAARRAQAARFRDLGGVSRRSDRQRDEIVNVADGEPAELGRYEGTVSEEEIGVAGQQPDRLGVDRGQPGRRRDWRPPAPVRS